MLYIKTMKGGTQGGGAYLLRSLRNCKGRRGGACKQIYSTFSGGEYLASERILKLVRGGGCSKKGKTERPSGAGPEIFIRLGPPGT